MDKSGWAEKRDYIAYLKARQKAELEERRKVGDAIYEIRRRHEAGEPAFDSSAVGILLAEIDRLAEELRNAEAE